MLLTRYARYGLIVFCDNFVIYYVSMPDLIETQGHRRKQPREGIVPCRLFMPQRKQAGFGVQWGSIEASDTMFRLGMDILGLTRFRLWKILGGEVTHSGHAGRRGRLAQYMMERLAFLFYLKGFCHVNTGGIYDIDWDRGIVYFNQGEPLNLEPPVVPIEEKELVSA